LPAVAAAAEASSPSPASTAITALTLTPSVPAGTTIFATVPSSTASTSMVALSVSISAITSPGATLSPSLTSHLARLPSSIVGESAGMVISIGIAPSPSGPVGDGLHRRDDLGHVRQCQLFQIGGIGHRHVLAGDGDHRRVEMVEGALHDLAGDMVADRGLRKAFLDHDEAVRSEERRVGKGRSM